jgi:hypothetical protein
MIMFAPRAQHDSHVESIDTNTECTSAQPGQKSSSSRYQAAISLVACRAPFDDRANRYIERPSSLRPNKQVLGMAKQPQARNTCESPFCCSRRFLNRDGTLGVGITRCMQRHMSGGFDLLTHYRVPPSSHLLRNGIPVNIRGIRLSQEPPMGCESLIEPRSFRGGRGLGLPSGLCILERALVPSLPSCPAVRYQDYVS